MPNSCESEMSGRTLSSSENSSTGLIEVEPFSEDEALDYVCKSQPPSIGSASGSDTPKELDLSDKSRDSLGLLGKQMEYLKTLVHNSISITDEKANYVRDFTPVEVSQLKGSLMVHLNLCIGGDRTPEVLVTPAKDLFSFLEEKVVSPYSAKSWALEVESEKEKKIVLPPQSPDPGFAPECQRFWCISGIDAVFL